MELTLVRGGSEVSEPKLVAMRCKLRWHPAGRHQFVNVDPVMTMTPSDVSAHDCVVYLRRTGSDDPPIVIAPRNVIETDLERRTP